MNQDNLIYLKNLFSNGFFGAVSLGMNFTQVRALLGEPTFEYQYCTEHLELFYGNIQFSFRGQVLSEICWVPNHLTYNIDLPSVGSKAIDPWIIWNGLTLIEAESELMCNGIEFRKVTVPKYLTFESDSVIELITICNARLIFRGYLNWFLEKFSLSSQFKMDTSKEVFLEYYNY
ncbi:hypothetical protein DSM106972_083480 [Dulcicalothrix desertica PCC 7102]|uniref:Uncharacterized protein n=1 Tax=Dulcicalothrix desertica PCC 7102 TaxID=232991 RepID=A0A433UUS8_9CYAN|nr:hypothetical protein [Dulcicalothrix desertica]RUS97611.1 hypothetical protein DSM106972_083480 [Dulcicalothrix desertica PCC 7102]TWH54821.1 hypothetical protein CAL7102_02892 [Dulcicalothrix desertica PCC 7102]